MPRLLLLRHAQSVWNAESRWQGWADPPLSELGRRQAHAAARSLLPEQIDRVVSSDLRRALETAVILASQLGLGPVATEAGLRERNIGEWAGCTTEEILLRWPGQLEAWTEGTLAAPPGGEDRNSLKSRVLRTLAVVTTPGDCDRREAHRRIAVVTHGGVIRMLERRSGAEPGSIANAAGRWFDVDAKDRLVPGEAFVVPALADQPVAPTF
jgi:broad specificity phosphatase PhoE